MNISRFFVPIEKVGEQERIHSKKKGRTRRSLRFGTRFSVLKKDVFFFPFKGKGEKSHVNQLQFPNMKELWDEEKRKDRKSNLKYSFPLIESKFYSLDNSFYFVKTGLKKNIPIKASQFSIYSALIQPGKENLLSNWLDLRFSFLTGKFLGFRRGRWTFYKRKFRKQLSLLKEKNKDLLSSEGLLWEWMKRSGRTASFMKRILYGGLPLSLFHLEGRDPVRADYDFISTLWFLKKRFYLLEGRLAMNLRNPYTLYPVFDIERLKETTSHYVYFPKWKTYKLKKKLRRERRFLKSRKKRFDWYWKNSSTYLYFSLFGQIDRRKKRVW